MILIKYCLYPALLLVASSCASSPPLPSYIQTIRILRHTEPPLGCIEIGLISATGLFTKQMEDELKHSAYMKDGNVVAIDRREVNRTTTMETIYANVYKCKDD